MPRIHREVATLMKNLKSQFDGQVKLKESTFDFESEDDCGLDFLISPNDGTSQFKHLSSVFAYIDFYQTV